MVEMLPTSSHAYHGVSTIPEDSSVDDVSRVAAAAVAARVLMGSNSHAPQENRAMTREEHNAMMHELSKKRAGWRTPRRGWSLTDSPVSDPSAATSINSSNAAPAAGSPLRQPPETTQSSRSGLSQTSSRPQQMGPPASRPPMPAPRRSYSVTDYEPPSQTHPLSLRMNITDLPAELHYVMFDFLDPIDSTCLGLTNKHFYDIHRRMHGSVPLSSRREGPNDLEWAWRGAGPLFQNGPALPLAADAYSKKTDCGKKDAQQTGTADPAPGQLERANTSPSTGAPPLERLRVKGQVYCRKCGISRCELHRHLKEWMEAAPGRSYEYCAVTGKYGPQAPEGAREFCYLKSPKKPQRCGRHAAKAAGSGSATTGMTTPGMMTPGAQTPSVQEKQEWIDGKGVSDETVIGSAPVAA